MATHNTPHQHEQDYLALKPFSTHEPFKFLNGEEIEKFYNEIDTNKDGHISFDELERRLEDVYNELVPDPRKHHLHHPERRRQGSHNHSQDVEKGPNPEHDGIHAFLCALMPNCQSNISKEDFVARVRSWNIPSQDQNSSNDENKTANDYRAKLTTWRKARAYWTMMGLKILFITFVFLLTLGMSLWQLLKYATDPLARAALGWGVIVAKGSAGALYPLLFFMLLSMSRWFATACRRFYYLSRFVNWDRHQSFHVWMACLSLFFASLHAISHLSGTFRYGSDPARRDAHIAYLGPDAPERRYIDYVRSLPGWSGLTAIGLFWTISLLSEPHVRAWSYEVFQLGHLLMFPFIGFICAHGALQILQYPMMGFWLIIPSLLVIGERSHRIYRGFVKIPTTVEVLDDDTVALTCRKPGGKPWRYTAGQYVFLQVPSQSFWQWHPFTISACRDDILQLHIKSDGDWTSKLRETPTGQTISVGIDGPFGAPAQRFYEYDRALIIGAGVGVTPFSAILTDLETNLERNTDPWARRRSSIGAARSRRGSSARSVDESNKEKDGQVSDSDAATQSKARNSTDASPTSKRYNGPPARRVDFHWLVREKNYLLWFSSLLNRAHDLSQSQSSSNHSLQLNITPHITMKRKNISQHIFRYLLDAYRSPTQSVSALTGLKVRSSFGRPDFEDILGKFYGDLVEEQNAKYGGGRERDETRKVGVFYCGPPVIGEVLSDLCEELTRRAKAEGYRFRFDFRIEVFG